MSDNPKTKKIFDNSGKNTENEIYDTSHRQYWQPPGQVAWKDNLIGFFGIVFSVILVMLIDCFVLHPIPAPEGTFDLEQASFAPFVLAESGCEYADATVLSSETAHHGSEMFVVEKDGEVHLIRFHGSILFTRKISDDVLITDTEAETQTLRLKHLTGYTDVTIENGRRITNISGMGLSVSHKTTITVYIVLGVAIAVTGSVIWGKIKKRKNNA